MTMPDTRAKVNFYPDCNTALVMVEGITLTCISAGQLWKVLARLSDPKWLDSAQAIALHTPDVGYNLNSDAVAEWLKANEPTRPIREAKAKTKAVVQSLSLADLDLGELV